ncbi:MAG: hypothetical protein JO295_14425 [Verrucomicrobia bacterium]|nr:hypothetical protein [Verrucomicrobiota bacterium]
MENETNNNHHHQNELMRLAPAAETEMLPAQLHAGASPFKLMVDPVMRQRLREALFKLIDHHDESLAAYVAEHKLSLDSYKEYIELFARSLRETMDSEDGVRYLLKAAGFDTEGEKVNLQPVWRWK